MPPSYNPATWIKASFAPTNQTGLAYYLTRYGKPRIVRAVYVQPFTVMYDGDDDNYADYDVATGEFYLPSGWYERLDSGDYDYYSLDGTVTHFMPLPEPPEADHLMRVNEVDDAD